ncbi:MAG: beta-N-acetylhexosaminidase [Pseudomonadota bacterium]
MTDMVSLDDLRSRQGGTTPIGTRAFVCSLAGTSLTAFERAYLRDMQPWGVILFARNVDSPRQVKQLTTSVRQELGWHAPILIDQEGGRVQRLKPPHWRRYPPAATFGEIEADHPGRGVEAAQIAAWMMAHELLSVGVDVNCTPVLDVRFPGTTDAIGDRSFHTDRQIVATLGRAVHDAFLNAGVVPVIKHVLGHGRAVLDSHFSLPHIAESMGVLEQSDFFPFRALADAPLAMTGHLVFEAIDEERPATLSRAVIDVLRNDIGFSGALVSDDLAMAALDGSMADRARMAIEAGCDLALHCTGKQNEMDALRDAVPLLEGVSAERCASALLRRGHQSHDQVGLAARLDVLLAGGPSEEDHADPTEYGRTG